MQPKTSNFQIVILIIFSFFVLAAIILFATTTAGKKSDSLTQVVAWGTVPTKVVNGLTSSILDKEKNALSFTYIEKDSATFEKEFIEALADGKGPDVVLLPQDQLLKHQSKFFTIPFKSYPLRTFKDQFIDVGDVYVGKDGVNAVPFLVDPMVMYWNKTHFVNASIVNPPKYWDEFTSDVAKLTKKDSNFNVRQSGTALGEYQNINHAKDILSVFLLQAGVPIVIKNDEEKYLTKISGSFGGVDKPAQAALTFYTDFANPTKDSYSWNKSLPSSLDVFLTGDASTYFGYASELPIISLKNPNLNFDITMLPQVKNSKRESVFAKIYGFAILKSSKNIPSAFTQIIRLTNKDSISALVPFTNLPPVRKDVLADVPSDPYMKVFYDSALRAETWPDPDPIATEKVFKGMIESVIVGSAKVSDAVGVAQKQMQIILGN